MPAPHSVQRVKVTGSLFKGVVPAGAVYVGRPAPGLPGSPYQNMFAVKTVPGGYRVWNLRARCWCSGLIRTPFEAATVAVLAYDAATGPAGKYRYDPDALRFDLAGRDLACWCPVTYPDDGFPVPCHGNVLLSRANGAS